MTDSPCVIFLLPVYNEYPAISELLHGIRATMELGGKNYAVVAVDDGSTDGTAELLAAKVKEMPLQVITHAANQGLAATLMDGFKAVAAVAGREDVVVCMDADNTHDPAQAPQLLAQIERGAEIVIASRYRPGARQYGVSFRRRLYSWGVRILAGVLLPIKGVRDHGCGYRAFRARVLVQALKKHGPCLIELGRYGFICTTEYLVKFSLLPGVTVAEAPFQLHYERKQAPSKMNARATIAGYALLFWRYWRHWR